MECGDGTVEKDGQCVPAGTASGGVTCGDGTVEKSGTCLPTVTCGDGTTTLDGKCVPDVSCGDGTVETNGKCVPTVTCGDGTVTVDGKCEPTLTCGVGTSKVDDKCVPDVTCGTGTTAVNGLCVPDAPGFIVRTAVTTVQADGFSKVPVFAIGTQADGTPALDPLVFSVEPASAGTITATDAVLTPLGFTTFFTPCNSTAADCTGTFTINVALASDPATVVATTGPLQLAAPTGVGSSAPCLGGGDVLFLDGQNDFIFSGTETITQGSFSFSASANHASLSLTPSDQKQGLFWFLDFDTSQIGVPLAPGVFDGAQRYPFEAPGHPGLSLDGDGRGCNTLTGDFQVEELHKNASGAVDRFTATFIQHCEGGPGAVRGCVHVEK